MNTRLTVLLDRQPVYPYAFVQGSYEDRRDFVCVHREQLSRAEIGERIRNAVKQLPEKIDMPARGEPDLFERALVLAGFVCIDDLIPLGLWLPKIGVPAINRLYLERNLETAWKIT